MKVKIVKEYAVVVKDIDRKEKTLTIMASTGEKDRSGEYIPPEEWKLVNYEKNPVILWAHKYDQLPVAKAMWSKATKDGLMQKIKFASHLFAQECFDAYEGGFMNAFSVGFMSQRDDKDFNILRNCELLEVSCVPVPCNANALAQRAAAGLFKSPEMLAFVKDVSDKEAVKAEEKKAEASKEFKDALYAELEQLKKENEDLEAIVKNLKDEKAGRVLSAKNREIVAACHTALADLLSAADNTQDAAHAPEVKKLDKAGKFVIITEKKVDAPNKPEILADKVAEAMKQVNIGEIVSREIRKLKGEVE